MSGDEPPPAALEDAAAGDLFASALWFDLAARHALPPGARALHEQAGGVRLALREAGARRDSLTTPYSQAWAPIGGAGADFRAAGTALGTLWRGRPPGRLELIDPAHPGLDAFLAGLAAAGLALRRYDHMAQWHEPLAEGLGWAGYLAARPPALRNTLRRKRARAGRLVLHRAPGAALEAGIGAFEAVRARSWKPAEPFPAFDAALMRALAPLGTLRLGLLFIGDEPVAAQYWVLDRGGRRALVPKLFHDEAHKGASPGTVLTAMMIERLIEEDGVRELDFGRGDDGYKGLWVSRRRQRIGVLVADPRHPAGLLALARHGAGRLRARLRGAA
ncbi:MAG: GNAT family N-acetyltransferase [Rubritepida sp.]|nr:GNAT family N-acetyltransferase [Rubritepida sp.]